MPQAEREKKAKSNAHDCAIKNDDDEDASYWEGKGIFFGYKPRIKNTEKEQNLKNVFYFCCFCFGWRRFVENEQNLKRLFWESRILWQKNPVWYSKISKSTKQINIPNLSCAFSLTRRKITILVRANLNLLHATFSFPPIRPFSSLSSLQNIQVLYCCELASHCLPLSFTVPNGTKSLWLFLFCFSQHNFFTDKPELHSIVRSLTITTSFFRFLFFVFFFFGFFFVFLLRYFVKPK